MCKVYGYCRISTAKQSIERQERNILAAYPDAHIVREVYTGTKSDGRKEFEKLVKTVKEGDTIVFDAVDRMSRDAADGIRVYNDMYDRGVNLVFLKNHMIDTQVYKQSMTEAVPMTGTTVDCILKGINEYIRTLAAEQIKLAFDQAQAEVEHLHQRTKEGIETARLNGKQIGRAAGKATKDGKKATAAKKVIRENAKCFGGKHTVAEVIKLAGCSRNSYFKYVREMIEEDNKNQLA